eukprot:1160644-Pelagomonas_calceolata.AAC.4
MQRLKLPEPARHCPRACCACWALLLLLLRHLMQVHPDLVHHHLQGRGRQRARLCSQAVVVGGSVSERAPQSRLVQCHPDVVHPLHGRGRQCVRVCSSESPRAVPSGSCTPHKPSGRWQAVCKTPVLTYTCRLQLDDAQHQMQGGDRQRVRVCC